MVKVQFFDEGARTFLDERDMPMPLTIQSREYVAPSSPPPPIVCIIGEPMTWADLAAAVRPPWCQPCQRFHAVPRDEASRRRLGCFAVTVPA